MRKQGKYGVSRPVHAQPLDDKKMGEQVVSCLMQSVMTIFIFGSGKAFCVPKSRISLWRTFFWALILGWLSLAPAWAVRFPSAKERADGDTLYQQAFTAYQAGDYVQAQGLIEKADTLKPDQPDGWNLRGMVYLKQNAFDKAEAAFSRAVALDPKLWAAQFNLAEAPFQGKDYARARARFEKLLGQTDRYKETKQWELVQYKGILCDLLTGNAAEAARQIGRLPEKGGVTPAYLYAQAALAFSKKDAAGARRYITTAQSSFSPTLNDLFSNSLVEVGWQTPPAVVTGVLTAANAPLPASSSPGPSFSGSHEAIVIDPKLEAAAADPLPEPDSGARPVMPKIISNPLNQPHPAMRITVMPPVPLAVTPLHAATPPPDDSANHRGLLLE